MKKYILLAAVAIALAACNNDDNYIEDPVAAHISATIGQSAVSRASETSWAPGDEIGITMGDRYLNMRYKTESGNGIFSGTAMYFLNKREPVTITAYYPFDGTEGSALSSIEADTKAAGQTGQEQPKIDFLYAVKENVTGADPDVRLVFSHQMSQITLTFKNGNDGTDVRKIRSYEIDGLVLSGTFNPATGVCATDTDAPAATLGIDVDGVANGTPLPSLILFPQTVAHDSVTLKITDSDNQEFSCKLNFKDDALVSGNNYQWTITVNKTGLVLDDEAEISDWNNQPSSSDASSVLD